MKVYNQEKTQVLTEYDLEKGHLESDTITMSETPAVEEQSHIEVIAEYPNGGKEIKKVIDVAGQAYKPKHEEEIAVYIPYTEEELQKFANEREIQDLRDWFETYYTQHWQKYNRLIALGKLTDEGTDPQEERLKLYETAETNRTRIQELEGLLNNK